MMVFSLEKMVNAVDLAIDIPVDHKNFLISSMASNSTLLNSCLV